MTILSWAQSQVYRHGPQCSTLENPSIVPFVHRKLPAKMITYRGFSKSQGRPSANIIFVGGLGSHFECTVQKCFTLAYEFQKWSSQKEYINIYVFNHLERTMVSNIVEDANVLFDRIQTSMPNIPLQGFGHSMGTGILLESILQKPYSGLVLQNPYNRASNLVKEYNLENQESFMLGQPFRNDINVQKIHLRNKTPIVIVSSRQDNTIPFEKQSLLVSSATTNKNLNVMWIRLDGDHSQYLTLPSIRLTFDFLLNQRS